MYSRSEGILLAADNAACDIMLFFCALTVVIILIVKERESGITALIKPLRHGRSHLATAKSAAVLLCCIAVGILLYGSALVIGASRFGIGEQDGAKIMLVANENEILKYHDSEPDKEGKVSRIRA